MKLYWAWMGQPNGRFMLYYPAPPENPMTVMQAFQTQFQLESRYLTPFYRWFWDGFKWVFDARTAPELLAQT